MKAKLTLLLGLIVFAIILPLAEAQLSIPSDGSDADFAPVGDVEVDLSQAVSGRWDDNNAANAGKGIYDKDKWAIVFKYRSVNIGRITDDQGRLIGARVKFKNHPSRAPVVWLVQGDVQVNGIIDLNGETRTGFDARINAEPGPGGFRGGAETDVSVGNGFGPGGGGGGFFGYSYGGQYAGVYGNPEVLPLIGGSGSIGQAGYDGGGGAILIASAGTVTINGRIMSNGRGGDNPTPNSASSGAVRIIANRIVGVGEIDCVKDGRIRLEAKGPIGPEFDLDTYPDTVVVSPANPPRIWPPDNAPWVRVLSVDGQEPLDEEPEADLERSADLGLENDNPVIIVLQTRNLPLEGAVFLRIAPKWASGFQGGNAFALRATYVSGT